MGENRGRYRLHLLGAFRLERPDGTRLLISSKRGQGLIAMLATAASGERARGWLQSRLWGSRGEAQAQASLRRELSTLRQAVNVAGLELVHADHHRVWLDLDLVDIDLRHAEARSSGEFLEGMDIPGEELFEDWLREERSRPSGERKTTPAAQATAPEFALRPSLAVLPFVADEVSRSTADGIAEDLIDRLSRLRWLPIIARSSSFAVADSTTDARSAGLALGARYIVEGALRTEADTYRLSSTLIDAETGQTLWSNRVPITSGDEAMSLDSLLTGISAALGLSIDNAEQQRAIRKPQSDLNVSDLIWKGRWHLNRLTGADAAIARSCFEQALEREPGSPEAIIQLASAMHYDLWTKRADEVEIRTFRKMAQRAIVADLEDSRGHLHAGIAEIWLKQPLRAITLLSRAIEMNPSLYLAHAQMGSALYLSGEPEKAIESLRTALRLSPNDTSLFYTFGEMAIAHLMLDQFEEAIDYADRAIMLRQAYWYGHVVKINSLVRTGDIKSAKQARAEFEAAIPGFSPDYIDWLPFLDSCWHRFLKDGLNP